MHKKTKSWKDSGSGSSSKMTSSCKWPVEPTHYTLHALYLGMYVFASSHDALDFILLALLAPGDEEKYWAQTWPFVLE